MDWLSAGASIVGGLLGSDKGYSPAQMARGNVKGLMQAAEQFGINPLTLLNAGLSPSAVGKTNNMGSAVADAMMFLGDKAAKRTDAAKLQQVAAERDRLQEKVVGLTIRPKVPGVYGPMRMGGQDAAPAYEPPARVVPPVSGGAADRSGPVRPLAETDKGFGADPRRAVDNQDVKTHPGYMVVDNPNLPLPMRVPTLDGDEALQWYDYPSLALPAAGMAVDFIGGISGNPYSDSSLGLNPPSDADRALAADEWKHKKTKPKPKPGYRFPQDSGYTVRKRKAPYLP